MAWHLLSVTRDGNGRALEFHIMGSTETAPSDMGRVYETAVLKVNANRTAAECVELMQAYHDEAYPPHRAAWVLHNEIRLLHSWTMPLL
jgi:hypothetical protein